VPQVPRTWGPGSLQVPAPFTGHEQGSKTAKNTPNEEAGCKLEEWKDFLKPYSPLDPEPGLGGILSLGSFLANASYFSKKISHS
jgi:hypothetical protein